jgi:proteic killer suppression protein
MEGYGLASLTRPPWLTRYTARSFGNRLAGEVYDDRRTAAVRHLPPPRYAAARRTLLYLHEAESRQDLRGPPGNRLEALEGDRKGGRSIRLNQQWRLVFRWSDGHAFDATIILGRSPRASAPGSSRTSRWRSRPSSASRSWILRSW